MDRIKYMWISLFSGARGFEHYAGYHPNNNGGGEDFAFLDRLVAVLEGVVDDNATPSSLTWESAWVQYGQRMARF